MKYNYFSEKRRALLVAGAAVLAAPEIVSAAAKGYGIEGQLAPELEVSNWIDGQGKPTEFKLGDQSGKFILLECWQAWCPGCHSHGFPTLQKVHSIFKDSAHFIAVGVQTTFEGYATNTADKMREMQIRYELPIAMGFDAGDPDTGKHPSTMISYRTGGTPWVILISPDGYVLYNDFGMDGDSAITYLNSEIEKLG